LEKLGVNLDATPEILRRCLDQANICFAFARSHHPAMKHVGAARSALGIPTIFNLLGPLTNPAGARHQLLGVFAPELTDRLATVLRELGSERAWVVHADDGLDELSTLGPTRVSELQGGRMRTWTLDPKSLGLPYARLSDLQVSGPDAAADVLRNIFDADKGPMRDIVLLNAAAALVIAGQSTDLPHALDEAARVLDDGSARRTLETLVACSRPQ
jgi:anthranilate phosphoribosyltransferase